MDGVRVVTVDDASIRVLKEVTQEIKDTLNARLVEYCYGRVKAAEAPDYYSLDLTIGELFKLYDTKSEKTKVGIAGELIVHLLMPYGHEKLVSAALYLNKEERAIKKEFDLTFYDIRDGGFWYGEVKAGKVSHTQTADSKVRDLIGVAERSLHAMFTSGVCKKRWDPALIDADATLQSAQASSVKKLLRADFKTVYGGRSAKVRYVIALLRNGMSFELAHLIAESFREFVGADTAGNTIELRPGLLEAMESANINDILLFDVRGLIGAQA